MQNTILIIHVVVGLLFILTVLMQDKGVGFGGAIGGSGGGTGFYASQRGAAKVIHYLSVICCVVFFVTAVAYVMLPTPQPSASDTVAPPAETPSAATGSVGVDPSTLPEGVSVTPVDTNPVPVGSEE